MNYNYWSLFFKIHLGSIGLKHHTENATYSSTYKDWSRLGDLAKEVLNGINFLDWYRTLRIVLKHEQKLHHLEEALPEAPPATATAVVRNAYTRRVTNQQEAACLMLVNMTPEIQKNLEDRTADIL
ncbi:hypothetical protein Tco_1473715 [Tanacetum coccineum]